MTVQYGAAVQNGRNNSVQTIVGTSPRLRVLTGAPPANCAAAQTGSLVPAPGPDQYSVYHVRQYSPDKAVCVRYS